MRKKVRTRSFMNNLAIQIVWHSNMIVPSHTIIKRILFRSSG